MVEGDKQKQAMIRQATAEAGQADAARTAAEVNVETARDLVGVAESGKKRAQANVQYWQADDRSRPLPPADVRQQGRSAVRRGPTGHGPRLRGRVGAGHPLGAEGGQGAGARARTAGPRLQRPGDAHLAGTRPQGANTPDGN